MFYVTMAHEWASTQKHAHELLHVTSILPLSKCGHQIILYMGGLWSEQCTVSRAGLQIEITCESRPHLTTCQC